MQNERGKRYHANCCGAIHIASLLHQLPSIYFHHINIYSFCGASSQIEIWIGFGL